MNRANLYSGLRFIGNVFTLEVSYEIYNLSTWMSGFASYLTQSANLCFYHSLFNFSGIVFGLPWMTLPSIDSFKCAARVIFIHSCNVNSNAMHIIEWICKQCVYCTQMIDDTRLETHCLDLIECEIPVSFPFSSCV